MATLDFPEAPAVGDEHPFGDFIYVWDGEKWTTKVIGGTGSGVVFTVNDVLPDENGNVELVAADVGALPTSQYTPLPTSLATASAIFQSGDLNNWVAGNYGFITNALLNYPPITSPWAYIETKKNSPSSDTALIQTAFPYRNSATNTGEEGQWYRLKGADSIWSSWIKQYDTLSPPTIEEIPGLREELDAGGGGGGEVTLTSITAGVDTIPAGTGVKGYFTNNPRVAFRMASDNLVEQPTGWHGGMFQFICSAVDTSSGTEKAHTGMLIGYDTSSDDVYLCNLVNGFWGGWSLVSTTLISEVPPLNTTNSLEERVAQLEAELKQLKEAA